MLSEISPDVVTTHMLVQVKCWNGFCFS